jgi:hypothetical protein
VEGFAEWLPAEVYNNPIYQYPDGTIANLETPTWNTPSFANGDTVEGRIAGTLIDISDTANENFWDFAGEGRSVFAGVYVTFLNNVSDTLNEFLTVDRVNQGFEFSDSLSRGSAYQNTIDYQFRDPLVTRVERVRPTPVPAQNYGYNTSASFWSIVALRQPGDYDLRVYDNRDLSGLLTSSTFGSNTMDFVAVDSNRRSFGDYYAQVSPFGGSTGNYSVEYVQGNVTVPDGTHSIFFSSGDVANVEDSFLSAGVPTFFRVVPAAGQDIETFLMRSDASNAATFAQGRGAAVRTSNAGGAGVDESFSFTESASQWDGLVVTNRSGTAGTYTVYRDTTAPTGSVFVNAGAPRTNIRDVTAYLSASDAETGAYQMRVAFDGVLDTEPWVPYATTRKGTLPTGDGTKTVAVQFRNNALMPSAVFKDTIVLDRRPNLVVTAISNPPGSIRRGRSFSVTDTTRNTGPNPTGKTTQTRYYLSVDKVKSGGDILLTGARSVPSLPVFTSNTGTRSVTVPTSTGTVQYFLIACSDATNVVSEFSETDNCRASATKVKVNP